MYWCSGCPAVLARVFTSQKSGFQNPTNGDISTDTHTHTHTQTAGVSLSPRIEGSLHSSFSSSADVEKLVALVYRQQDARLRRIAGSRMQRTVTLVIQAWR